MIKSKYLTIIVLLLLLSVKEDAVAQKYNIGITASPSFGFLLPHHKTVDHLLKRHAYGVELGLSLQTNGSKQWHHDFFYPTINFLAYYGDFGNPQVIGKAFAFEGSIYLPYFKHNGWSFGNKLNAGIGYLTKRYDPKLNPKNNVIGSHINCIVSLGFLLEKQFKQQAIGLELNMKHMSNGALRLPNLGVNIPAVALNYTYYFHPIKKIDTAVSKDFGQPLNSWKFFTQVIASAKQVYPTGGDTYGVVALLNYVHYRIKKKVILEGGIDAGYDPSIIHVNQEGPLKSYKNNFTLGAYLAYVLPIHHLQLMVGMGRYLINPLHPHGMWYHRFGARFRITPRLWANITIKSHWAKADYFEYGIAYQWN